MHPEQIGEKRFVGVVTAPVAASLPKHVPVPLAVADDLPWISIGPASRSLRISC